MNLSCQIFIKGFTVQKIARMKNGINRYEKVRIDLGWKPKECLQSYKEFCQSLDIFGVVHVHVCAQHRRAGVSAAVNFFGASTRLRRVSAPKKLTAASTPALLCFAHTCTYISYTKNVSWLAKFFMWLATFFKFHPRYNNVLFLPVLSSANKLMFRKSNKEEIYCTDTPIFSINISEKSINMRFQDPGFYMITEVHCHVASLLVDKMIIVSW